MKYFKTIGWRVFIAIAAITLGTEIKAQSRFNAGITLGAVATDVKGMDLRDNDNDFNKLGFTVGGIVNSQITRNLALQFEINFIQKGSMQRPDSLNMGYYNLRLNYLEIPIMIKRKLHFYVFKVPNDRFDVEVGLSFAKLVYSNYSVDNMSNYLNPSTINPLDVSLLGGINFHISQNFLFNIRYSNSVMPPIKRDAQISNVNFLPYSFNAGNNMVFQFTLKYLLKGSRSGKED